MAGGNESITHFNKAVLVVYRLDEFQKFSILFIIIVSLILNVSVLMRSFHFRATFGKNYSVKCFLMCSLAVSDLLESVIGYSLQLISFSFGFAPKLCQASGFTIAFFAYVSIITTITLNIESYIHICKPWIKEKITMSRMSFQIACSCFAWLYAFFWAVFPLVFWNDYSDIIMGACTINWETKNQSQKGYIISLFMFCIVIPFTLMVICSIQNNKAIRQMKFYAVKHFGANSPAVDANLRAESAILRLTLIGAFGFLIAWMPYSTLSLIRFFGVEMHSHWYVNIEKVSSLCAKISCILNPLIYAYSQRSFREDVLKLLKGIAHKVLLRNRYKSSLNTGFGIKLREMSCSK